MSDWPDLREAKELLARALPYLQGRTSSDDLASLIRLIEEFLGLV